MFTGLVEEVGSVIGVRRLGDASRLALSAPRISADVQIGDSVSINGVCLTAVVVAGPRLEFDAVAETLRRSTLGELRVGDRVNLERAMSAGARFGGHIVQGHVDAVGSVQSIVPEANSRRVSIAAPTELLRYVVEKGSITVDGISLTVADLDAGSFAVAVIPHTWSATTLGLRRVGDHVNLEADILAKYVERLLEARLGATPTARGEQEARAATGGSPLTEATLIEHGFD
jgi:riboflavin synthase